MHTKAEAVVAIRQMLFWEGSPNLCQVTKVKKKTYYILDVALLADHKVKLKGLNNIWAFQKSEKIVGPEGDSSPCHYWYT